MDLYLDFDDHSRRHRRGRRGYGRRNRSRKPWIIGIIIVLVLIIGVFLVEENIWHIERHSRKKRDGLQKQERS